MPTASDGRRRSLRWLGAAGAAASLPLPALLRAAGDDIRLGQSAPISGPAAHLGIEYQRGMRAYFDEVNARGGVGGRRIELVAYDDAYEPTMALGNTTDLIEGDKVFALVGYVGAESVDRCLPLAVRAGVPLLAPLTGADHLRRQPSKWLWHLRPGYGEETALLARTLATIEFRRIGVLVQNDADGRAAFDALGQALTAVQSPPPLKVVRVERDFILNIDNRERDIAQAVQQLRSVQPQAVVFLATYASTAAALKALRAGGYAGGASAISLASAAAIGPLLGAHAAGLTVTQVVPSPFDISRPVVAAYQKRMLAAGNATPEYVSLEGWIAAQGIAEALRRSARNHSREAFVAALESLAGYDTGGFALRWDAQRRQATSQVVLTVLDARGRPRA
jgi:branched-chain amino acid transport system substrate-binding protein